MAVLLIRLLFCIDFLNLRMPDPMCESECATAGGLGKPMTPIEQLKNLMSDISERCWAAGWLMHTEFVLWKAVHDGPMQWGQDTITAEDIAQLKRLADLSDGWIVWDDTDGEVFVYMEQWLSIYASIEQNWG